LTSKDGDGAEAAASGAKFYVNGSEVPAGGGGTDHGGLTGLGDDDHSQYHNDTRGDARYTQKSNNLSDVASEETTLANLINGAATNSAVNLTNDKIAYYDADISVGSDKGRGITIGDLFEDVIEKATNDTSPNRQVEFLARDGSGNLRAVLFDDLHPGGQNYIVTPVSYTGNGSSGRTLTLTGINRAHVIYFFEDSSSTVEPHLMMPGGGTGTQRIRNMSGATNTNFSLSAPAAGTAQVLTMNTTGTPNTSGRSYVAMVIGTPI
jgi:hypothetical protein